MRYLQSVISTTLLCGFLSSIAGCGDDPDPAAAPSGAYDVARYELHGEHDWSRGRLDATVLVTLDLLAPDIAVLGLDSAVAAVKAVRSEGAALPFTVDAEVMQLAVDISGLPDRDAGRRLTLAIEYEAASGGGLREVPGRAGDPAGARALYTFSEPQGAPSWMPCHDRPDDRAIFAVALRMEAGEEMVANGDLVLDEEDAGGRIMGYETQYPLPTYLMAFAVSDFEVEAAQHGELPISIWHRPGVSGDYQGFLGELDRQLTVFEERLGPYPFEKYALVMLPDYSGGMENASVSFQTEIGTAQPLMSGDVWLAAHELGHQWFGDQVTVATWDDVWIKEGMATLLSAEAARAFEDQGGTGSLFGDAWYVEAGAAIRDTSLAPDEKYTSGPYDRAAWLFNQIRSVIGEDAFWGALRGILEAHRNGVVGTEDVLAAFAPALGPDASARARRAVDALALPALSVAVTGAGGAVVTLEDPEGILVAPMEVAWHREGGATERLTLAPGEPLALEKQAEGDLLVIDPDDVHPDWQLFIADEASFEAYHAAVAPLRAPGAPAAVARLAEVAGAHQVAALSESGLPPVAPADFDAFVGALDAESARAVSIGAACEAAAAEEDPAARAAWVPVLTDALTGEPHALGLAYASYSACNELAPAAELFATEWAELAAGLTAPTLSEARVVYLSRFTLPHAEALAAWGSATELGHSLRVRSVAARQVRRYAATAGELAPEELAAFRARVAELLGGSEASEVLRQLIPAVSAIGSEVVAENAGALAALQQILRSPATRGVHGSAVCAAVGLTRGDAAAWAELVAGLEGAPLSARAEALLADPSLCQ